MAIVLTFRDALVCCHNVEVDIVKCKKERVFEARELFLGTCHDHLESADLAEVVHSFQTRQRVFKDGLALNALDHDETQVARDRAAEHKSVDKENVKTQCRVSARIWSFREGDAIDRTGHTQVLRGWSFHEEWQREP